MSNRPLRTEIDPNKATDAFHDMTQPSPTHNLIVHDATIMNNAEAWVETLTAQHLRFGEEEFARINAQATANAQAIRQARETSKKENAKKAAENRAAYQNDPIYQFSKKFRYINSDRTIIHEWMQKQSVETLQKIVHELETRSLHYKSLFAGDVNGAITAVHVELNNRKSGAS